MAAPSRARNPQAVLFACGMNSVRSPMAESLLQQMFPHALYVNSAGVKKGELDPFAVAVMAELGQDISTHKPVTFEELDDWEGLNFDLIITLSPEAHHKALELTRTMAADVEYWPTHDPTTTTASREQKLAAYREVMRHAIDAHPQAVCQCGGGERLVCRSGESRTHNHWPCHHFGLMTPLRVGPSGFRPDHNGLLKQGPSDTFRAHRTALDPRRPARPKTIAMLGRPKFVLASGSPRRLALLNQAGIEPDALRPADVDETPRRGRIAARLRQPPGAGQGGRRAEIGAAR